jgi:hypothetical protein
MWLVIFSGLSASDSAMAIAQTDVVSPTNQNADETLVDKEGFTALVSDSGFDGWEGKLEWFRNENGTIIAGRLDQKIPRNEFLCTQKVYGDFDLRLEAKLVGEGDNAGIQFRTTRIPNNHEVSGYQADMGTAWNRAVWGALYDESRRNKMLELPKAEVVQRAYRPDNWNTFRILCQGNRIQIWLNDILTVDYLEADEKIDKKGIIGLQIHSGLPAEAHYRHIRIKEL